MENKKVPEKVEKSLSNEVKRVLTEKIPEKIAKKLQGKVNLKAERTRKFLQVAMAITNANREQQELIKQIKSADESIKEAINRAFKKLKLANKGGYTWRYDGRESFIGVLNPPKPEIKKENK